MSTVGAGRGGPGTACPPGDGAENAGLAGKGTAGTWGNGAGSGGSASAGKNSGGACKGAVARQPGSSDGAGTVLVAAVVAVLLLALALILGLATVTAAAGRAATAADLAALAAADAARGLQPGEPCAVAAATAQHNGALLDRCERSGDGGSIIDVWTRAQFGSGWQWLDEVGVGATGRARAGPPPQPWAPQVSVPRSVMPQLDTPQGP